jgi:hypothetical protein
MKYIINRIKKDDILKENILQSILFILFIALGISIYKFIETSIMLFS